MDPFNDDDSILSEALGQYEDTDDVDDLQLTQMCEETEFNHDLATPDDEILSQACLQMCEETEFNHDFATPDDEILSQACSQAEHTEMAQQEEKSKFNPILESPKQI